MDDVVPPSPPPRVPPVEPELLGTAIFLFAEYLQRIADETPVDDEDDEGEEEDEEEDEEDEDRPSPISMREVLEVFAEELGTSVPVTLALYMRVTALFRLLAGSPTLARLAAGEDDGSSALSEDALIAAARLDLHVTRTSAGAVADFDPRQFRDALTSG